MLVDDQPLNIRVLHELLQGDYDLYMATSGAQALALAQQLLPDLILLDLVMPDMDGYAVLRQLQQDDATRTIPVVFVTATQEEADEEAGLALGAVDFITKPIKPAIVRARVRTQLTIKRQADQLRVLAQVDGLTGIANRRRFDEMLSAEWLRCARQGEPLSLILIDVDFFKRYNDHYGHQMGDTCLRQVAHALADAVHRSHDLLARYGGEEFVCLLPDTDADGAAHIGELMLERIRALRLPHAQSDVAEWITVSAGCASVLPEPGQDPALLIALADQRLYRAKQQGRARLESAA
ncbi:diguanylate cyclase (GGDEF) domain-containing protein [Andreprevotia lacus DSM 23236]|jgi:diguanylate cyclase (GGDEF)-like protein|uniref:diguanylate cyclase n=1 Tax=Andreprevotia lacus DSM 23236 TaxID=1121001 RepID=A0A1W1X939_9NEIS|nr:diguanylate cyclase [Andreprevotia lacus]SMC20357.1 diguanylate cyclase (GGDEF) domain-containing protein [Andreprevotia lacus DSM 23236]